MLFFLIFVYTILLKKLKTHLKPLQYDDCIEIVYDIFILCKKYISWDSYITPNSYSTLKKYQDKSRILLISNHVSIVDFFFKIDMVKKTLPTHKLYFVSKSSFEKIPVINEIICKICFTFDGNFISDKEKLNKLLNDSVFQNSENGEKYVIILFPEGKIVNNYNIKRSDHWCKKQNIETPLYRNSFGNVVCPHIKGLYIITKYFKPDIILDSTLLFIDDIYERKGKEFYDYLFGYLPQYAYIHVEIFKNEKIMRQICSQYDLFETEDTKKYEQYIEKTLLDIWREKEIYIENIKKQCLKNQI